MQNVLKFNLPGLTVEDTPQDTPQDTHQDTSQDAPDTTPQTPPADISPSLSVHHHHQSINIGPSVDAGQTKQKTRREDRPT